MVFGVVVAPMNSQFFGLLNETLGELAFAQ